MTEDKSAQQKKAPLPRTAEGEIIRVPLPKKDELMGVVEKLLGNARMYVRCTDGKKRLGRVPGGKRRALYIREGNLVIVKPWEYEEDTKCDIVYKYRKVQVKWLRKNGYLEKLEEEF
ncbi:translation initiation factor eIF-1A [archaeon]|nr:translation initiation factor eIF-1A [archaeon]